MRRVPNVVVAVFAVACAACASSSHPASAPESSTSTTSTTRTTTTEPASARWSALPRAPISGRISSGAVWTGHDVIVWGGVARGTLPEAVADGAAYDPAANSWRKLAPAPAGVLGDVGDGAAWTGDRVVFWAGNSPDGPAAGATYDPATDTWQRLPKGPLGPREGYVSVWTGQELLLIGGTSGDQLANPVAGAVNPSTGVWRQLHGFDALRGLRSSGAVVVGGHVYGTGVVSECPELGSACRRERSTFFDYDPEADTVREIDRSRAPALSLVTVGPTATSIVFSVSTNRAVRIVRYDVDRGTWTSGPTTSCTAPVPYYSQSAWLDSANAYVAGCGAMRLAVWRASTNRWTTIDAGPSPLNTRSGSAVVWTGREVFAWSGTVSLPGNPTPADGATIPLG